MATVNLRAGESQEELLRRFRKQVSDNRILSICREKRWFVSKSEQRRKEQKRALRRMRKRQQEQQR